MGTISILLADDSVTIQKVVGIIFGGEEYTLAVVGDGNAAVSKAQEMSPDVMLIDALMPGMSGYEVCEAVRRIPSLSQVPIVLMTGSFEPFDENKARQCGANDFITKPFESQQIIAKVKELVGSGGAVASSVAAPVVEIPVEPAFETHSFAAPSVEPEPVAVSNQDDPWGAFTQTPSASVELPEEEPSAFTQKVEPEPFAEEPPAPAVSAANIGTSWVPVEEHTFEFQEQPADNSADAIGMSAIDTAASKVVAPVAFEPLRDEPVAVPAMAAAAVPAMAGATAVALTEEQLKGALAAASKEVIERIVWEVVPDLAEAMIKEAIRRIKEGA
jgi:CheY-like chemotaxis protein